MLLEEIGHHVREMNDFVRLWSRVCMGRGLERNQQQQQQMNTGQLVIKYFGRLVGFTLAHYVFVPAPLTAMVEVEPGVHVPKALPASTATYFGSGSGQGSRPKGVEGCASRIVEGLVHMSAFRPLLLAGRKEIKRGGGSDILPQSNFVTILTILFFLNHIYYLYLIFF
jgi:hypothetical protein